MVGKCNSETFASRAKSMVEHGRATKREEEVPTCDIVYRKMNQNHQSSKERYPPKDERTSRHAL